MSTKKQHFVPRVYLKAWESKVSNSNEPEKIFDGVYVFKNTNEGEGYNIKSILWKPHLYTVGFQHSGICTSCSKIKSDFVNMIYEYLKTGMKLPVYGKLNYSIIKTKKSIDKHFFQIEDWDFYYENGNLAKKASILNHINEMNSYVLESGFDNFLEQKWEHICTSFIDNVHSGMPLAIGRSEKIISEAAASDMLSAFFIMLCRNPIFNALGIYTRIKENLLYPIFKSMCNNEDESRDIVEEFMTGIWYSELYKMLYKSSGGFYHKIVQFALEKHQMILFEVYDNAGTFITSDNPAFKHFSVVERNNHNGYIFPISPKHLIFIANGEEGINVVDFRYANRDTVRYFNRLISSNKTALLISKEKNLFDVL